MVLQLSVSSGNASGSPSGSPSLSGAWGQCWQPPSRCPGERPSAPQSPGQASAACFGRATATATSGLGTRCPPSPVPRGAPTPPLSPSPAGAGRGGGGPSSIPARPPPAASRGGEAALEGSSASSRAGSGAHGMSDGGFLPGQRFGKERPAFPPRGRGERRAGGEVRGWGMEMEMERGLRGELPRRFPREKQGRRVRPGLRPAAGCRVGDEGCEMRGAGCGMRHAGRRVRDAG